MKIYKILLILILLPAACLAGEPRVIRLGADAGLSNNYIMGIAQDRNGYVWVATESGLNRFEGDGFRPFRTGNSEIAANELNRIVSDRTSNSIWICTQRHGLDILDCDTYKITHFVYGENNSGLSSNGVTDVYPLPDGNAWVATYTDGLNYIDRSNGKAIHYNKRTMKDWPDDKLWTVVAGANGTVYMGHVDAGFSVWNPATGKITNYRHREEDPGSLPGNAVRALLVDRNGNVWVGTDRGLALFDAQSGRFTTFRHDAASDKSLISDNVYHIYQSDDDRLWISTENGGVSVLNLPDNLLRSPGDVAFRNFGSTPDEGVYLSNKTVHAVFEDSYGNIWIGTYGDGVNILGHYDSHVINRRKDSFRNPLSDNAVMSLCGVGDTLYVGTDGKGMDIFIGNRYAGNVSSATAPLRDDAVLAIMRDNAGKIWIGTYRGDVAVRHRDGHLELTDIPGAIDVRCFALKPDGTVLAGTGRGLAEISPDGKVTVRYASERLETDDEWIRSILVTPDGNIWVGSFGNGISVYDSAFHKIHTFGTWKDLRTNMVNHLIQSHDGKIWAATGDGLVCFSAAGEVLKTYLVADGLPDNSVKSLWEDPGGNIWLTTGGGISMLSPDGKISTFSRGHGIDSSDFQRGCVARRQDGTVVFGSHDGLFAFQPSLLSSEIPLPAPVITDIKVFGGKQGDDDRVIFSPGESLELSYKENTLNVGFGILDASVASSVVWSYNVEGIDDRWYPATPESGILMRDLSPGKYRLVLRASVPNQTKDAVTVLPFEVRPPVWAAWYAKLLYLLLAVGLLWFGMRFYRKRLDLEYDLALERKNSVHQKELNAEKLRFFTNITHELRTPLTLILGPLEDMKSDSRLTADQSGKIGMVHKAALRLLDLINTILEFRKTETQNRHLNVSHSDLALLVEETGRRYRELNTNRALTISTEIAPGDYTLWFDRATVSIIIDNLMSNACKYTAAGKVELRLFHTSESGVPFTEISVSDTGLGIDHSSLPHIFDRYYRNTNASRQLGTGIGLALVYNLVHLHQGEIFVDSEPGKGSVFRFRLQTENRYPEAQRTDPASSADASPKSTPQQEEAEETPADMPRVLVVDDDIDILSYVSGLLEGSYIVDTATDGSEGLEKAAKNMPDIIVTDVMMPKMDGMNMVRKLKEAPDTSHIPIVIVTAKIAEEARLEAYESGADSFIVKPFSSKVLIARLRNILATRHRYAAMTVEKQIAGTSDSAAVIKPDVPVVENPQENPIVSKLTDADESFLARVGKIINDNIAGDSLDVGFIAGEMCMSHSTLYRKIKTITGLSVAQLIRKYRARRAAELLRTGKYTVSEISMMVGMGSMGNFRQCFRDEFNMTPSDYLRTIQDSPS